MAKLWGYRNNNEQTENPTSVYLDNIKWKLWVWNKEKWENDFHELDKFLILTVGFTIKWKVWDDTARVYTNTYYSNEIRQFNETLYAIDMTFVNGKANKRLASTWKWKINEATKEWVKFDLPQWVGMKAMITVLDLNDWLVKCFPIALTQYFGKDWLSSKIESFEPTDILSYNITKMYTNGLKDKDNNEVLITEEALDKMKWSEAAKYKNRYISELTKVSEGDQESIESAEELIDEVESYYVSKKEYYAKTFGNWSTEEKQEEWQYAKPAWIQSDEDFKKEVQAESQPAMKAQWETKKHNSTDEISVEDVPF